MQAKHCLIPVEVVRVSEWDGRGRWYKATMAQTALVPKTWSGREEGPSTHQTDSQWLHKALQEIPQFPKHGVRLKKSINPSNRLPMAT